jgi:Family of unknown function (DUF6152)
MLGDSMSRALALTLVAMCLTATTVSAHHSYAAYDRDHPVSIEGDISQVLYANPHVILTVRTNDAEYTVEWLSLYQVSRWIVAKGRLAVGDRIVLTGRALRDRTEHRISLVTDIRRPSDGWTWSRQIAGLPNSQP